MRKDWEYKKLGEIAFYPNDKISVDKIESNHYVGVENLLKDKAGILFSDQLPNATTATRFKYNDILLGNIRPYLKKIWLSNIEGGASGDVIVIRSSSDNILPNYLFKLLSSDKFFDYFNLYTKGAKMPRGDKNAIAKFIVPIPPKSTQLAIVAELDKLNEMIRLKKKQLEDYDQLAQSIFYEMFGDPVENEKGWEVKKLGNVCDLKAGKAIKASELSNDNPYPCYGGNGIRGYINRCSHLESSPIIGRQGAYCGTVNFAEAPFYATEHAVVVKSKQNMQIKWLYYTLVNLKLSKYAKGQAQPGIAVSNLNELVIIPLPPLPLQQQFAARIEAIERQKQQVSETIKDLETLLASRMQYWFD